MACVCGNSFCKKNAKSVSAKHGTYSMYVNHSCRCADCRRANAEVGRRRYEKSAVPKPEVCGCGNASCPRKTRRAVVHGLSAYFTHKCRCLVCSQGMREYQRQRRAKLREATAELVSE